MRDTRRGMTDGHETRQLIARRSLWALAVFLVAASSRAAVPAVKPLEAVKVLGEETVLYQVRDVETDGETVVVLTEDEPAIHLFVAGEHRSFGANGQGPGDLESPRGVLILGDRLSVLDAKYGNSKIVTYSLGGEHLDTVALPTPPGTGRIFAAGDRILVQGNTFGESSSVVVAADEPSRVLVDVPAPEVEEVTLWVGEPPSMTMPPPFSPVPCWTLLADGTSAFWDGRSDELEIGILSGETTGGLRLPDDRFPLAKEDERHFLERKFARVDYGDQKDVFGALREKAGDLLEFPEHFPRVLKLEADPSGGVWVQRADRASGEVWSWLRSGRPPVTVAFPAGRRVYSFGSLYVAARAVDEDGIETVELFDRTELGD